MAPDNDTFGHLEPIPQIENLGYLGDKVQRKKDEQEQKQKKQKKKHQQNIEEKLDEELAKDEESSANKEGHIDFHA